MSHVEYTKEDSRKDRIASLTGLAVALIWVFLVGFIAHAIAMAHKG